MKRVLLGLALVMLAASACRLVPAGNPPLRSEQPTSSTAPVEPPAASASRIGVAASQAAVLEAAPEACGFPPGTLLEFAGRSTTAELDVQEVVGDPMSDDLADIYITRDKFEQGQLYGRLVCAVFVETPGFVEITVHPEDGGRFEPPPPGPVSTPPVDGLSRADAIDAARATLEDGDEWEMTVAEAGPIGQVMPHVLENGHHAWARDLSPERWVWRLFFMRGDEGVDVFVDYLDGAVLGTAEYIVN